MGPQQQICDSRALLHCAHDGGPDQTAVPRHIYPRFLIELTLAYS
jgi:hypothetical protein